MLSLFAQISGLLTKDIQPLLLMANEIFLPIMGAAFLAGVFFRFLMFFAVKGQAKFINAIEKQVVEIANQSTSMVNPFSVCAKETLDAAFKNAFKKMSFLGRMLLIREGAARLVKDTLVQLEEVDGHPVEFLSVAKTSFWKNSLFNRVMGVAPMGPLNSLLNAFPNMFIFLGVVGALAGIFGALPGLVNAGATGIVGAQLGIERFTSSMTLSMFVAMLGAGLALTMMILNFVFSPERMYVRCIDRFATALEELHTASSGRAPTEMRARKPQPIPEPVVDEEPAAEAETELAPESTPEMSAQDIMADIRSGGSAGEKPEQREDSQITKIEEMTPDPEELRKLHMYHHPEEAARVDSDVTVPLTPMAAEPPQEAAETEDLPFGIASEQPELTEADRELWKAAEQSEVTGENEVQWTGQGQEWPEQTDEAKADAAAEEILEDDAPIKPPKAA